MCSSPDCLQSSSGVEYRGQQHSSFTGLTCLNWSNVSRDVDPQKGTFPYGHVLGMVKEGDWSRHRLDGRVAQGYLQRVRDFSCVMTLCGGVMNPAWSLSLSHL